MKPDSQLLRFACLALAVCLLTACGNGATDPTAPPKVGSVHISPRPDSLRQGDTVQLVAVVKDESGRELQGIAVSWVSRDPGIVSIESGPRAVGVGRGRTTLVAQVGEVMDSIGMKSSAAWASVHVGHPFTCARTLDRAVYCWGSGVEGELGNGVMELQLLPDSVHGGLRLQSLGLGDSTACGSDALGRVLCWGRTYHASLGIPSIAFSTPALSNLAFGSGFGCGVGDGVGYCWGASTSGQLGSGVIHTWPFEREPPTPIAGELRIMTIDVGVRHACAVTEAHKGYCWGASLHGEAGTGSIAEVIPHPMPVVGDHQWRSIKTGFRRTCGLTLDGQAYCWGNGILGRVPADPGFGPQAVMTDLRFEQITIAADHACGLTNAGKAYCWGYNSIGQLGNGTVSFGINHPPKPVSTELEFLSIDAHGATTCAVTRKRDVYCWGANWIGQIGDGTRESRLFPTQVQFPT